MVRVVVGFEAVDFAVVDLAAVGFAVFPLDAVAFAVDDLLAVAVCVVALLVDDFAVEGFAGLDLAVVVALPRDARVGPLPLADGRVVLVAFGRSLPPKDDLGSDDLAADFLAAGFCVVLALDDVVVLARPFGAAVDCASGVVAVAAFAFLAARALTRDLARRFFLQLPHRHPQPAGAGAYSPSAHPPPKCPAPAPRTTCPARCAPCAE